MTIAKDKQYRTLSGLNARIYATDGCAPFPVHGAIQREDGCWVAETWDKDGRMPGHGTLESPKDLVEVRPHIKREMWTNVYPNTTSPGFASKKDADACAGPARIACVRILIDCEEGEGLS